MMVNNVGGAMRPKPGKEKEKNLDFVKLSWPFPKSAIGCGPRGSKTPGLINIMSSKTRLVFFHFTMGYCTLKTF